MGAIVAGRIVLVALLMAAATPLRAAPALSAAGSAEMQALLGVQIGKLPVDFDDRAPPRVPVSPYDRLFMWNEIGLDTTAIDHTPPRGEHHFHVFGEQFGPARSARAMAIVNIAAFEAVNAITHTYTSYTGLAPVSGDVSMDFAIARASHDAQVWLYPSQVRRLDAILHEDVKTIHGSPQALKAGDALGRAAAQSIIVLRTNDGSQLAEPVVGVEFFPKQGPGYWSPDPVSHVKIALGAYWHFVKPFVIQSSSQFRAPVPPALTSDEYTQAFLRTDELGGDPKNGTPTKRDGHQTLMGIYWTYDGTPALCAPPRLYNQVARTLAFQQGLGRVDDAARYMALVNTAMADAALSAWDSKWYYQFWRPVTAIRAADTDGNPKTKQDPTWYPLGAQATNTKGPNFTPPFPAYPSGHAVIGGALFETMRHYWPDKTPFTFTSDEYNGKNRNIYGRILPLHPLSYHSFSDAEYDNAESRIYIGVHWQFDADQGIKMGNAVADYVYAHAFGKK